MGVSDLVAGQGKVNVTLDVIEKGDIREFNKFGKAGRVCNAKAKDESGQITLTLWNEDIDKVNVGSKIKITNGYVSEWQGEKQLSTGKFGQLEVLEGGAAPANDVMDETEVEQSAPGMDESMDAPVEDEPVAVGEEEQIE